MSGKRESRRFHLPEHSQEQALASLVSIQEVISHLSGYDLRVKSNLEQLSSFYCRTVRDGYVASKRRGLAESVAFSDVELH